MTAKTAGTLAILLLLLSLSTAKATALTTDELLRLKKADVSEEIVVYMVESGYNNAEKVCKLKEAGYKDRTILAIIRSEMENGRVARRNPAEAGTAAPEKITFRTEGRIRILWHLVYQGKAVVQNKFTADNVTISFVNDNTVKFEWNDEEDLGLLEVFRRRPFRNPFYWEIAGDDVLGPGQEGYPWMLKSATSRPGKPATDDKHFWVVYFEPKDARITGYIENASKAR